MVLEVALLNIRPGQAALFEAAFAEAQAIIASMPGYLSLELKRCLEEPHRYLLMVEWETRESHTVGFRAAAEYLEWKRLFHHFYDPFPTVEHFENVSDGTRGI